MNLTTFGNLKSIIHSRLQAFKVILVNADSGSKISYGQVTIQRKYRTNCATKKCPTRTRSWSGESDPSGQILVPRYLISTDMTFHVQGYNSIKLSRNLLRSRRSVYLKLAPLAKKISQQLTLK